MWEIVGTEIREDHPRPLLGEKGSCVSAKKNWLPSSPRRGWGWSLQISFSRCRNLLV